jgi:hypothetical protein
MATLQYNDQTFRAQFPEFANTTTYPVATIAMQWSMATGYISADTCVGWWEGINLNQQTNALNLMTAHLLFINTQAMMGQDTGVMTGSSIDKISVQLQAPPEMNQWQWWLNQSPYGKQLLALLQIAAAGGRFYSSGAPVRYAFRQC